MIFSLTDPHQNNPIRLDAMTGDRLSILGYPHCRCQEEFRRPPNHPPTRFPLMVINHHQRRRSRPAAAKRKKKTDRLPLPVRDKQRRKQNKRQDLARLSKRLQTGCPNPLGTKVETRKNFLFQSLNRIELVFSFKMFCFSFKCLSIACYSCTFKESFVSNFVLSKALLLVLRAIRRDPSGWARRGPPLGYPP